MILLKAGTKDNLNKNIMKELTFLELKQVNGGCARCKKAGKFLKENYKHAKEYVEGIFEGVFG